MAVEGNRRRLKGNQRRWRVIDGGLDGNRRRWRVTNGGGGERGVRRVTNGGWRRADGSVTVPRAVPCPPVLNVPKKKKKLVDVLKCRLAVKHRACPRACVRE